MRLLMTTDTVGGVWTFTRELAQGLLAEGHAVALVSFGGPPSSAQNTWCQRMGSLYGERFLYEPSSVPLEWMQGNENCFQPGAELLQHVERTFRPDLLHANQMCWGALPGLLPRVVTVHSDVLSWAEAAKPDGLERSAWLSRYVDLVQSGIEDADAIVAPTHAMQQAFVRHFQTRARWEVIPNGRSVKGVVSPEPRTLQAVSAGRLWDEAKGLGILQQLHAAMPIVLAGEESFEGKAAGAGDLRSVGVLDEDAMLALFAQSSVYLACSLYEPFGLAPLEAALCGCAVVARDIDSLREVWGDGALFFRSATDLAYILDQLAHDAKALHEAQAQSVARAETYTTERMTRSYLALYKQLLRHRRHHTGRSAHAA